MHENGGHDAQHDRVLQIGIGLDLSRRQLAEDG